MNKTVDPSNSRARKQVIMMLGTVVLCFFVCLIPFRILILWIIIAPTEHLQEMSPEKYYNILYFSRIMLYINSAINPILYNLMSSKFRIGFCKVCVCYKNARERVRNGRARRKRAGTVTTGSTTSSSLTRTTDSLKKLFRNRGLDRCNTTKSDTETDSRNNVENTNEDKVTDVAQNNLMSRIFGNKKIIRQQSAPVCTETTENHKRSRIMSEGDVLERPAPGASGGTQEDLESIKVGEVSRKSVKLSDLKSIEVNEIEKGQGSLRRNVLINSAKARNVSEHKCNDDEQKARACVVAFKETRSSDCDLPESFV
ncbi:Thyrotropin-releasing hormone receptor [Eumeta japonica]|uniref:Thyrotropin-releasing hormone receptor n=1 Tax=Eumeta variegata TaxID=151549 RepID=A0A4C1UKX3_EUMVA|nr:Thyrotropin-releasing hormone receptor [Eumeta japonica]